MKVDDMLVYDRSNCELEVCPMELIHPPEDCKNMYEKDKNVWKLDENERKQMKTDENGRKRKKTNKNVRKRMDMYENVWKHKTRLKTDEDVWKMD